MDSTKLLVALNLIGMFPGYATFGWVADRLGRRRAFILYTGCAALLVPFYAHARSQSSIMVLGALVAFFGTVFLRFWDHGKRTLPHCGSRPGTWFYLQWRTGHEFHRSIRHRLCGTNTRAERSLLSVRGWLSVGCHHGHAIARDVRQATGINL
jgi:hypothetical protein